jgi:Initiator Replication protein
MGVSENKYRSFKEFNRNVISVAVNEINQKADITIEPQYRKSGRSITAIQFLLRENENYKPSFKRISREEIVVDNQKQQSTLVDILMKEFTLSAKQAGEISLEYTPQYVMEKINLVKTKHNIDHPGAYLIAALKKDYKENQKPTPVSNNRLAESTYQREAKEASQIISLKNKYMSYKVSSYSHFIQQQTDSMQKAIQEKFEQYLQPKLELFRLYKKKGLSSPFVMQDFITYIDENCPQIIGDYLSFDDYITSEEG